MSKDGPKAIDVGGILRKGTDFLLKTLLLNNPVARLVHDAQGDDLWTMLVMLRPSSYLTDFLWAVMELPMENWYEQKLDIHRAFKQFNGAEISTLIKMYRETGHDSPVIAHLDYNVYWTHLIQTEIKGKDFDRALVLLKWARAGTPHGLPLPGIPAQANKTCLAKLDKDIKKAERSAKKR